MDITDFFSSVSDKTQRHRCDVAQGVALPNVTLINPFYIGPYEGYFCVFGMS